MKRDSLDTEFEPVVESISRYLRGKRSAIELTLAAFFAGGHLLLEDIPGVGKTTLAKRFAEVMGLDSSRVQFTADLLPSDIIGVNYYDAKGGSFIFKKGPVFTQFLLADEINRSMPRTQSALLEAMEERQITIDGESYPLPKPFFVIATQNPHDEAGTYPLPLSQLDRFICSFGLGYPDRESERAILSGEIPFAERAETLMDSAEIENYMRRASAVKLNERMLEYLQDIVSFTRHSGLFRYGLSTRGALALASMTRSMAMLRGRDYAIADDLLDVLGEVCSHRLVFEDGGRDMKRVVDEIGKNIFPDR